MIPAHPLALTADGSLDERRQRALTRYYAAAGAGGVAVGVHTTQFELRAAGLYDPVLALAAETLAEVEGPDTLVRVAGVAGTTSDAVGEAERAAALGYHAALVSLRGLDPDTWALIAHVRAVADVMPVFGFYLQQAVGGPVLGPDFWRQFVQIKNVVAIKIAPFDRYETLGVVRAVFESGRADEIALYTGNDDHILLDLLTAYRFGADGARLAIVGGLLGQWAVWTRRAVEFHAACRDVLRNDSAVPPELLATAIHLTDANAAIFDPRNRFAGCIPGIHEVLRRQGLLESTRCLDPNARLSPGQLGEIDRVWKAYPHLRDDTFVREHLDDWLR